MTDASDPITAGQDFQAGGNEVVSTFNSESFLTPLAAVSPDGLTLFFNAAIMVMLAPSLAEARELCEVWNQAHWLPTSVQEHGDEYWIIAGGYFCADPQGHDDVAVLLSDVMDSLPSMWAHFWSSVQLRQRAVTGCLTPSDFAMISESLHARYLVTGALDDIDGAIMLGRFATSTAGLQGDSLLMQLENLSELLLTRFRATQERPDIDDVLDNIQRSIALAGAEHHAIGRLLATYSGCNATQPKLIMLRA